jgi:hypothetical protein
LTRETQEVQPFSNERMADATPAKFGLHPHTAEKSGLWRRGALHEDHADWASGSDRDEDRPIGEVRAVCRAS